MKLLRRSLQGCDASLNRAMVANHVMRNSPREETGSVVSIEGIETCNSI